MNNATKDELDFIQNKYITVLDSFILQYLKLKLRYNVASENNKLINEILLCFHITAMRAAHRKNTLSYLIAYRLNKINKTKLPILEYLDIAKGIRENVLISVKLQEQNYRYPLTNVVAKKKSKTVYNFGYLYPVLIFIFGKEKNYRQKIINGNFIIKIFGMC